MIHTYVNKQDTIVQLVDLRQFSVELLLKTILFFPNWFPASILCEIWIKIFLLRKFIWKYHMYDVVYFVQASICLPIAYQNSSQNIDVLWDVEVPCEWWYKVVALCCLRYRTTEYASTLPCVTLWVMVTRHRTYHYHGKLRLSYSCGNR